MNELFCSLKLFVKDIGPLLWYAISNIKTQEMLISSSFCYISNFMIEFIIYELTGKQSYEGKPKAEGNG